MLKCFFPETSKRQNTQKDFTNFAYYRGGNESVET